MTKMSLAQSKSTKVKYKKAPQAPRRFKSAYMFYSTWKHKDIRERLYEHEKNIKTPEVAKMVSRSWSSLSAEERAPWDEMARKDKARFELEKSTYSGPWKVPDVKDPKAPKRPVSAFLCFSRAHRSQVKRDDPRMTTTQISAVLARMWKEASEEERRKYVHLDMKDRERYRRELDEYNEEASQGKKKREALAFQAISEMSDSFTRETIADESSSSGPSEESIMQDLMNEPIMIDGQDLNELTKSESSDGNSIEDALLETADDGIELQGLDDDDDDDIGDGDGEKNDLLDVLSEPLPDESSNHFSNDSPSPYRESTEKVKQEPEEAGSASYWEPIPLSQAEDDDPPASPRRHSPPHEVQHPHPSVVTPPKLLLRPKELVDDDSLANAPFYRPSHFPPDSISSRSYSAPMPQPHQADWYPHSVGLRPRIGYSTNVYGGYHHHHQLPQEYDMYPYYEPRRASWEPTLYDMKHYDHPALSPSSSRREHNLLKDPHQRQHEEPYSPAGEHPHSLQKF